MVCNKYTTKEGKDNMYNSVDKRKQDRFTIPDAKVSYKAKDETIVVVPLADISKSSMRFEITKDIVENSPLDFKLIISTNEKVHLKGNIVRRSNINFDTKKYIAIQFLPFGTWYDYNSPEAYEKIVFLFNKFCIPQEAIS